MLKRRTFLGSALNAAALCGFVLPLGAAELAVDGLKVHYTVQGTGPTILFVHGWTCDETSWRFQVPAFSRTHRVITVDLPGHGKSQVPAQDRFSMKLFASAVEAVRAKVGAERMVLVGHSMGAVVIRQYAITWPAHVAGLVAADGPLDVRAFAARPGPLPTVNVAMRENMIKGMFVPTTPEALKTEITKVMLGTAEATASGAMAAMFDPANQWDRPITAPALTVYAGTSANGQEKTTREVFPKWESTQLAGTGHFLMMEKPEEFNRLLAAFLKDRAAW